MLPSLLLHGQVGIAAFEVRPVRESNTCIPDRSSHVRSHACRRKCKQFVCAAALADN